MVVISGQSTDHLFVAVCSDLGFVLALANGSKPDFSRIIPDLMDLNRDLGICGSERELLAGMAENPPVLFSRAAAMDLNQSNMYGCSSSSSSNETAIANTPWLWSFATRPAYLSNSSDAAEFLREAEFLNNSPNSPSMDEEFIVKLTSSDVIEQGEAVIALMKMTKNR